MSRQNFFQFTLILLNILITKIWGKLEKTEPDLKLGTSRPGGPTPWGVRYKRKSGYTLVELRPRPRKGSNKKKNIIIPELVQRPTASMVADKNCR